MGKGYPSESSQMIETLCKYEGKKRQTTTANVGERGTVKRGGTEEEMEERGSGREKRYHLELLWPCPKDIHFIIIVGLDPLCL